VSTKRENVIRLQHVARADGDAAAVNPRISAFMAGRGYKTAKGDAGVTAFRRGSRFGSLTGFSPRKWAALVTIAWPGAGDVRVVFGVDTTGQTVTKAERAFWDEEMAGLVATIEGRPVPSTDATEQRIASIVRRVVLYSLGFAVIGGVLGIVVVTGLRAIGLDVNPGMAGLGAGVGAGLGVMRGIAGST